MTKDKIVKSLTIGRAAKQIGVNIQTLRYYERIGMLKPQSRLASGYRLYDTDTIKRVRFIKQAQDLGFTLDEIKELLNLRVSSVDRCEKIKEKAKEKLSNIQIKIRQLQELEATLKSLIRSCNLQKVQDHCPILERMEEKYETK